MATTLYLHNASTGAIRAIGGGTNLTSAWQGLTVSDAATADFRLLDTTAGTAATTLGNNTSAGPHTAPGLIVRSAGAAVVWSSPPLSASGTISGTVTFNAWASENSMSANATIGYVVWRVPADGTTPSVIVASSYGTEVGTSLTEYTWTATPTSTAVAAGDLIAVAAYWDDATSTTMSGTAYTLTFGYDGGTSSSDSFVQFTENLSFAGTPTGSDTYLLDDASDVSGTGKKKVWGTSASGSSTITVNTQAYTTSPGYFQWTDTAGGNALEWYTPQLQAVNVTGIFQFTVRHRESNAGANATVMVEVYKTDSNGSNPVKVGQGRLRTELSVSVDFTSSGLGHMAASLIDGERLMVRLYVTSCLGWTLTSGYTVDLRLEDSVNGVTYVKWPATLTEYNPVSPLANSAWGFIPI